MLNRELENILVPLLQSFDAYVSATHDNKLSMSEIWKLRDNYIKIRKDFVDAIVPKPFPPAPKYIWVASQESKVKSRIMYISERKLAKRQRMGAV